MNKAAIKNFAVGARKKLLASVKDKAGRIGITKENITDSISIGEGYAVYPTHIGMETTLYGKEAKQRENLVNRIKEKGYESVIEEVAYTWFNRIIAVRFMEVNDYLPSRIRVLSSETKGKFEPDIVTQAPKIDLKLTHQEIEEIISFKEKNELEKLFRMLFIKQCNELGEILPELFEYSSKYNKDYTEILLDISYTNEDDIIHDLLKIDEADFLEAVETIGWMYQYYNTEPKAIVDGYVGKRKVPKEDVPAKTQLFTPDWIVRYMVENSIGRLWLEGHSNDSLKAKWNYYLDEAKQELDVEIQLEKIRTGYKGKKPEDVKVIDPCMGSGHILVYAFEVLMQIYESCGYAQKDAASIIIEKNLFGLDIDDRAYQLAYFAVMMKGRKYDRSIFTKGIKPNLCAIQESNGLNSFEYASGQLQIDDVYKETSNYLINAFRDAKEYGSILKIEERNYDGLIAYLGQLQDEGADDIFMSMWLINISAIMPILIKQGKIMAQKYDIVITNPPYFSGPDMSPKLSEFVKMNFHDSKTDMFAVFIEKGLQMAKASGYTAMITMHSWMFLSSYEKLRNSLISKDIINMAHLGARAFEEISGEVVQTAAFVYRKDNVNKYRATFVRLVDYKSENKKKEAYLESKATNKNKHISMKENFSKIPGSLIAYWLSNRVLESFSCYDKIGRSTFVGIGMRTGDNGRYMRYWYEISIDKLEKRAASAEEFNNRKAKWAPYNKGGSFRKWYGNYDYVVNWERDGFEIKENTKKVYPQLGDDLGWKISNEKYYFKEGFTWSTLSTGNISVRFSSIGSIFDCKGSMGFPETRKDLICIMGFLNSNVCMKYLELLSPTLDFNVGSIKQLPYINVGSESVYDLVEDNIIISKNDWNMFEISWDFERHPLLTYFTESKRIIDAFTTWKRFSESQFEKLKTNEEKLNRIFIEIYGLKDELAPEVEKKDITIRKADLQREVKSFVSYAIGCMFGRYSLDVDGLAYAGGQWDSSKYQTFIPDADNVLPITDEEYFDDDIASQFVDFVRVVYGVETLKENLDFIAKSLGNKGDTSREVIRNYFLKDFYKDHIKTYQKRPIYWMFDSGKENGFKALIYLHRYNEDTVGRVRSDYLHETQAAIENAIAHCDMISESVSNGTDKLKAVKKKEKLVKQLAEIKLYDQAIAHKAHECISLDLDDGVVINYAKFQDITVSNEGKKTVKVDLLGKI